jgi:hypothetical protein
LWNVLTIIVGLWIGLACGVDADDRRLFTTVRTGRGSSELAGPQIRSSRCSWVTGSPA